MTCLSMENSTLRSWATYPSLQGFIQPGSPLGGFDEPWAKNLWDVTWISSGIGVIDLRTGRDHRFCSSSSEVLIVVQAELFLPLAV